MGRKVREIGWCWELEQPLEKVVIKEHKEIKVGSALLEVAGLWAATGWAMCKGLIVNRPKGAYEAERTNC